MGAVRKESTIIGGITYTTETFPASQAFDLYADVSNVIPAKVLQLIMLPVSNAVKRKRAGEATDEELQTAIGASMTDLLAMLETPGVLATIFKTIMREASDIPGGLSSMMKRVLAKTTASPIRIAGFEGQGGKPGDLVTHFDTHFGGNLDGMKEALEVCIWVLRLNLGGASSEGG